MKQKGKATQDESISENRAKQIYQILLIVSVVVNVLLAIRTQWNTERLRDLNEQKMRLEVAKTDLESQLLLMKNLPILSFSRIQYELNTFGSQLKLGKLIPFMTNVNDYRIIQNNIFDSIENGLTAIHNNAQLRATATFFVVANTGSATAYSVKAQIRDGDPIELGDLMPNGVLLIPTDYSGAKDERRTYSPITVSSLRFEIALGTKRESKEVIVPPPVAQAWVPVLENVRGIGRALATEEDNHLNKLLPEEFR